MQGNVWVVNVLISVYIKYILTPEVREQNEDEFVKQVSSYEHNNACDGDRQFRDFLAGWHLQ